MTKQEARQHISNLSNHKANRLVQASYKSTSLEMGSDYLELLDLANEAKKVLGCHRYQQSFKTLIKEFPTMTREYYNKKRKDENIT